LAIARDLADTLNAKLTSISSVINQDSIASEADVIGFVFPIYDFKPPRPMENFIRQLKDIGSKYLFAVCTYGITPSKSLLHFDRLIKSQGGHLSAGFAAGMPHNGVGCGAVMAKQQERLFEDWKIKREEICGYIRARKERTIESSSLFPVFFQPWVIRIVPSALKLLMHLLLRGAKSLAFISGKNCAGCGICARICPVNNITMVGSKPVWSDHCAGCFACLHWCPKQAISLGGHDMNIKAYHHPNVKISDMVHGK
jgi:ferredoxin